MGVNQDEILVVDRETKASSELSESSAGTKAFDAGQIWMSLAAAGHDHEKRMPHISSLPELDVHSKTEVADPRTGGKPSVAEELIDDLHTLAGANGKLDIFNQQKAKSLEGSNKHVDLPVIEYDGLPPGKIGILMAKNKDGHTYYTPFVSAARDPQAKPGTTGLSINDSAARELKIDQDLKNGHKPDVDVLAFNLPDEADATNKVVIPRSKDDLHELVLDKLHQMAEQLREEEALLRAKEAAALPDAPKPDPEFGYRRTTRTPEELRAITADFEKKARGFMDAAEPAGIQDRMKEFGKQAQKDIDFWKKEVNKKAAEERGFEREKGRLERQLQQVAPGSEKGQRLSQRSEKAQTSLDAAATAKQLAEYNLSYAEHELRLSKDQGKFTRHMQAKGSAAAIMSLNPDMEGSLTGHRFVLNAGHYAEDPKFPGFEYDGTAEWKLNLESEDVAGAMTRMAGGAVKLINQSELTGDKGMVGLANAIKAAKPEIAVGIHHDDAENRESDAMKGTLTLQCAKSTGDWSLDFAKASHMAKVNYAGVPEKYNKNGVPVGIREQCGRGVQGRDVGAPFILDEQFSTHKEMWKLARDPKVNAQIQFARVVAFYEYVNKTSRYKITPDTAKEYNDLIWSKTSVDDVFKRHPKVGAW